ncbi:MAG: hypothetical protein ACK5MT_20980 [Actinomycetales bacterium]
MITWLAGALVVANLVLAAWSLVAAIRAARPSTAQLVTAAVIEVALIIQAVIGVVLMVRRGEAIDGFTFVGYHVTAVAVLVAGAFWGIADRSRWGNGVFAIAAATEVVLILRLVQIWNAGA